MFVVRKITSSDIDSYRRALDSVARESSFLRSDQAPPIEAVSGLVLKNIEKNNPQLDAIAEGEVVGWCDIVRGAGMHEKHLGELGMGGVAEWRGRGEMSPSCGIFRR